MRASFVKSQQLRVQSLRVRARGFTVIETLVAIAILLLTVTAPLTIAEKGLASSEVAQQEITGLYLAQEAIEYIRNIRDEKALRQGGGNWLSDLGECEDDDGCGVDTTNANQGQKIIRCDVNGPNDTGCTLYQYGVCNQYSPQGCAERTGDALYGVYGHRTDEGAGWVKTDFTRKAYLDEIEDDIEASVTVRVSWTVKGLGERSVTVRENLFNWYAAP